MNFMPLHGEAFSRCALVSWWSEFEVCTGVIKDWGCVWWSGLKIAKLVSKSL